MKHTFFLILFVIGIGTLQAQENDTVYLNLDQALEIGLKNNYAIQISRAEKQIAQNNNHPGNAGMLPGVTAGIAQTNRFDNSESQTQAGVRNDVLSHSLRPNAGLQMALFNGFRLRHTLNNLGTAEEIAEYQLRLSIENTLSEIIQAYYAVLLEQERLGVLTELKALSNDRYRYVKERQEIGTAVSYDVLQVKNAFLQDSANYLSQESAYNTAMRRLNQALGDTSFTDYILTEELKRPAESFSIDELENKMLTRNANIEMLQASAGMSETNIKIAQSYRYPSLALNAGTDYTQQWVKYNQADYGNSYSYDFYANLSLSYTIFDGGSRQRQIANAQINAEISEMEVNNLILQLKSSLYALYDMYEVRKQVLKISQENLEAAELNLQISKDRFERGAINSFNYRDVQINYLNAAFTKLQAEYNLTATHTDLMRITGSIINQEK